MLVKYMVIKKGIRRKVMQQHETSRRNYLVDMRNLIRADCVRSLRDSNIYF